MTSPQRKGDRGGWNTCWWGGGGEVEPFFPAIAIGYALRKLCKQIYSYYRGHVGEKQQSFSPSHVHTALHAADTQTDWHMPKCTHACMRTAARAHTVADEPSALCIVICLGGCTGINSSFQWLHSWPSQSPEEGDSCAGVLFRERVAVCVCVCVRQGRGGPWCIFIWHQGANLRWSNTSLTNTLHFTYVKQDQAADSHLPVLSYRWSS